MWVWTRGSSKLGHRTSLAPRGCPVPCLARWGEARRDQARKGDPLDGHAPWPRHALLASQHHVSSCWSQAAALCYSWGASQFNNTACNPLARRHRPQLGTLAPACTPTGQENQASRAGGQDHAHSSRLWAKTQVTAPANLVYGKTPHVVSQG